MTKKLINKLLGYNWAGRRRYRAHPGNQLIIDVSRLEKYHRIRFPLLKNCQNVPYTIFIQISAAITGKCMFRHISAQSSTFKVCSPMF